MQTPLSDSPNLVLAPTNNQPALHHNQPQTTPQLHNQPPQHTTPTGGFIPIHTIPTNDQVGSAYNTNKNNSVSPPCGALSPDNVSGLEGLHLGQRMEEKSNEKPLILDESEA